MTPIVLPSSFLLRRPAITPTLNSTESKVLPLLVSRNTIRFDQLIQMGHNIQSSEACCAILKSNMRRFGVKLKQTFQILDIHSSHMCVVVSEDGVRMNAQGLTLATLLVPKKGTGRATSDSALLCLSRQPQSIHHLHHQHANQISSSNSLGQGR